MISYDDFQKVEIKIGKILSAEKIPETDKLLKLSVDFGNKEIVAVPTEEGSEAVVAPQEREIRQIVSGISFYFPDPQALVGTKCAFVTNLEYRKIKGFESQGMILAIVVQGDEGTYPKFSLFKVGEDIPEGSRAK